MSKAMIKRIVILAVIVVVAVALDQVTKILAFHYLPNLGDYHVLIPGWLGFSHVENDAIAFGIGSGNRAFMVVIMLLTCVLMIGIPALAFTFFKDNTPAQITLAVIEGGAIGNFIDRLFIKNAQGVAVVRDFVDLSRFGFANCNVADFCITLGAVALLIIIFFIGPNAMFPLKKEWREQAKRNEAEKAAPEEEHAEE